MTLRPEKGEFYPLEFLDTSPTLPAPIARWSPKFYLFKFVVDKMSALAALPIVLIISLALLILNPFFNPGPVFFGQDRMGMGGKRFKMWKFRSMTEAAQEARPADARVEENRITPLGSILRKYRIDELPNFFNVFLGQMSLVGPRPDAWDHSTQYVSSIARYSDRFRVRPGITGLAQVYIGYADTTGAIRHKAYLDKIYVRKSQIKLDLWIMWRTVKVVLTGFGAR